jgi:hypothetical protein
MIPLVYVPLLNWLLMIGTVLVAAIYNNVRMQPRLLNYQSLTLTADHFSWKCIRVRLFILLVTRTQPAL